MAFREGLKEWWNDPEKFWTRRYPNAFRWGFRRPTIRNWLTATSWGLLGIGIGGAVRDYILGHSLNFIMVTFTLAGLSGLAIMWWKDRRTRQ